MASIFTHPLVPIAAGLIMGRERVPPKLLLFASFASIIPDFDVIAFQFGVDYASEFGHRGFTHSIFFALLLGLFAARGHRWLGAGRSMAFLMVFIGVVSHPILDALTNGGLGVAFFWPIDTARYFFPVSPIEVSPIGASGFFSARGLTILWSEFRWVFLPLAAMTLLARSMMRRSRYIKGREGGKQYE